MNRLPRFSKQEMTAYGFLRSDRRESRRFRRDLLGEFALVYFRWKARAAHSGCWVMLLVLALLLIVVARNCRYLTP
jgi:hypothetical protein